MDVSAARAPEAAGLEYADDISDPSSKGDASCGGDLIVVVGRYCGPYGWTSWRCGGGVPTSDESVVGPKQRKEASPPDGGRVSDEDDFRVECGILFDCDQ